MNNIALTCLACTAVALVGVAAVSNVPKRLTARRVLELTVPANTLPPKRYKIEVSGVGSAVLSADKPAGQVEMIRESIFPTEFMPPQPAPAGDPIAIVPSTPMDFGKINVGWTVHLNAKPQGKLLSVYGSAAYIEAELVPSGYGVVAGPIYSAEQGNDLLTPNIISEPRSQTTITRFQLFALPGESYSVTFYRGAKVEKHLLTVSVDQ